MTGSLYSAADYAGALSALMPRGRAWSQDPASAQQQVLGQLAASAERLDAAAQGLVTDARPDTSIALLAEWEESLGLSVSPMGLSTAQRQARVVAALVAVGGQSAASFIAAAAALGATITITTYAPFRCGVGTCGSPGYGPAWAFAWSIHVVSNTGPLSAVQLLATLQALAPAETIVLLT